MQAARNAQPVESVNDWLAGISKRADSIHAKFAQVARDCRMTDAEIEDERKRLAADDEYWESRSDDGDEVAA